MGDPADEKTETVASTQPSKTTLYIAIGCGVLALILIVIVIITSMSGGDPTVPGGAAATAGAAAAEALRRRQASRKTVEAAQVEGEAAVADIEAIKDRADADAAAVVDAVAKADDARLKADGENLFGGGAGDKTDPGVPS